MIKDLSYNLPGYGFAKCYLLGQAIDIMDILEDAYILEKMKNTCQLGTMRYVYPGAHHTRYEYVFTQLMLISNIVSVEDTRFNVDLSRSSNLGEYEQKGIMISGGAVMQCLAILSNAGHMYDTFTSAQMLMRLLVTSKEENTDFYKVYRRNLPSTVRMKFDDVLKEGNYYKLHLFHVLHILQGLSRTRERKQTCDLCILLVTQLIDPKLIQNESTARVFFLYKKIRKIAYLSVDMVYTPASFGANLSRMIYSIASYVDDLFDESSAMNQSIQQLEGIIHQQIYDSPLCILNSTRIIQEKFIEYKAAVSNITDIFQIRDLLLEKNGYNNLHSTFQPKAIRGLSNKSTLLLSQIKKETDTLLDQDSFILSKLPTSRIAFGSQITQNLKTNYTAFGLLSSSELHKDIQTIISIAISNNLYSESDKIPLVKFAIQSIYLYGDFFFNLSAPKGIALSNCVLIGTGCKKISQEIRKKFTKDIVPDKDQLHEILSCATSLESINYSGLVICFVGGIKASKYKNPQKLDELDGLIYFPNRNLAEPFACIVEAKNYSLGEKDAEIQLRGTEKYLSKDLKSEIVQLNKCAYMKLMLKA